MIKNTQKIHIKEFDRRAFTYKDNNVIQKQIVLDLLAYDKQKHSYILDVGCGDGLIYQNLEYNPIHFVGIDASSSMLDFHPVSPNIELIQDDFDDLSIYEKYTNNYTLYSSSSLQWSSDLESLLHTVLKFQNFVLAIHTQNTFKEFRKCLGLQTFLPSVTQIKKYLPKNVQSMTKNYEIKFKTSAKLLKYIKNSGVSNGSNSLNIRDLRNFIDENSIKSLKFEVLFIKNIGQYLNHN